MNKYWDLPCEDKAHEQKLRTYQAYRKAKRIRQINNYAAFLVFLGLVSMLLFFDSYWNILSRLLN